MAHAWRSRKLRVAQPVVDVVAAQGPHQLGGHMQLLQRAVRAEQGANRAGTVAGNNVLHAGSHIFEGGLPVDRDPLPTLLNHRRRQTVRRVQGFVGKAVAVGNPAFIDGLVLQRNHAHDLVVFDLHHQVGAG